jgi:predicted component of type VI protein secretion system
LRQLSAEEQPASSLRGAASREQHAGERFIDACRAKLPLRVSVKNERSGELEDVFIERPWAVIGGDPKCDIRLLHPDVSQRHAYLQFVGSRVLCCDLGSRTGTHGSSESRPRGWLRTGEPVFIGPYSIRLKDNDFAADDDVAPETGTCSSEDVPDDPPPDLPPVFLSFANARNSAWGQTTKRITRAVTLVGWSSSCKVRLQHSSVGRAHCSLVLTPDGLWVVDLLCAGGTQVNGNVVDFARLEEGDDLTVGRFLMRISYTAPVEDESDGAASDGSTRESALRRIADSALPEVEARAATEVEHQVSEGAPLPAGPARAPGVEQPSGLIGLRPAALSLPPNHSLPDDVAQSLIQQFSSMQQQMFDHMQQTLTAMAQTMSAAHARKLDSIREELIRIQEVSGELQDSLITAQPVAALDSSPLAAPRSGMGRPPSDALRPPIRGSGLDSLAE